MTTIHVDPDGKQWAAKHAGADTSILRRPTQAEAEAAAKAYTRKHGDAEVVLHRADGKIRDPDTMDRAHESSARDRVR